MTARTMTLFQIVLLAASCWAGGAVAGTVSLAEAVQALENQLAAHPAATSAGPAATARYAAGLVAGALAAYEHSRHLDKPYISRSDGIDGRAGLYNPDNIYASALLAENGHYRIRGRRGRHVMLTMQILDSYPIVGLGRNLAVVDPDTLGIRPGDEFEILLGGPRPSGPSYWAPLPAGAKALLLRQTFEDWNRETPSSLSIERLDPGAPSVDASLAAASAGDYVMAGTRTWNEGYLPMIQKLPINQLPTPRASDAGNGGLGGQQSIMARYRIGPDQALVITVRKSDARYQGIQLGDPWFVTPNYVDHQVSLTRAQSVVDRDGRIRFVISLKDPGVANWLDPAGFGEGYVFMRWQGLSRPLAADEAPVAELVKLSDLAAHLPPETRHLAPAERAEQLARRQAVPIHQR